MLNLSKEIRIALKLEKEKNELIIKKRNLLMSLDKQIRTVGDFILNIVSFIIEDEIEQCIKLDDSFELKFTAIDCDNFLIKLILDNEEISVSNVRVGENGSLSIKENFTFLNSPKIIFEFNRCFDRLRREKVLELCKKIKNNNLKIISLKENDFIIYYIYEIEVFKIKYHNNYKDEENIIIKDLKKIYNII